MNRYFDTISGKDQNASADLLRFALSLASCVYGAVTQFRNFSFNHGFLKINSASIPIISIGNLTTGGTGKTPSVAWLVNWLKEQRHQPAILSRGYGTLDGIENDEKRLLDSLCPGVPHLQNRRRITGAREITATTSADVIVLDDGFQHRQLHRDLDFVLIDALNPWGYGHLLPRGLLREPLSQLTRADVLFITRCELATDEQVDRIIRKIRRFTTAPILRTAFQPQQFVNSKGETLSLEQAASHVGFAFCGIGNPEGFRRTLTTLAAGVPDERFCPFPDHYHYTRGDLQFLGRQAEKAGAEIFLTTRKDLVKIPDTRLGELPVWALDIGLIFLDDPEFLIGMLRTILTRNPHVDSPRVSSSHPPLK